MVRMLKLTEDAAVEAFDKLLRTYRVVAPTCKSGKGRFSDTDLVTYEEVGTLSEIVFDQKTYFSPKSVMFPPRETLFRFAGGSMEEAGGEDRPTIVFMRSCDIHALKVLDAQFLHNGGFEDNYYKRHRSSVKVFLLECPSAFEGCSCVSMGTNTTDDYAVFWREARDGYEVSIPDETFESYFSGMEAGEVSPRFVRKDLKPITIPEVIDESLFRDEMWEEYSRRCIACGRCNTSCPTCSCFTIQGIPDREDQAGGERRRIWSSCQVKNFATLAGGHEFRIPKGDRMRYKVLHKISDFKKRTGFHMCVGCGRCNDVCPEYISMFKCVEKINALNRSGAEA